MGKAVTKRKRKDDAYHADTGEVLNFPVKQRQTRRTKRTAESFEDPTPPSRPQKEWKPIGSAQKAYKQKILANTVTFGIGCAGTGKSYAPTMIAAQMLEEHTIERIVVTRPAVSDEDYGALPGELSDKIAPWFAPIQDILTEYFGQSHLENLLRLKKILFVPMGHLRGNTFKDAFVILDESQNTTVAQMKCFLTRLGVRSKCVITGDLNQTDIHGDNGLKDAVHRLRQCKDIAIQSFTKNDIVRSDIVRTILDAYEPEPEHDCNALTAEDCKTT